MNKTEFSGRPHWPSFGPIRGTKSYNDPLPGVIFTNGKEWTEQRRFLLKTLRDFGFGKTSMENLIIEEVNQFV